MKKLLLIITMAISAVADSQTFTTSYYLPQEEESEGRRLFLKNDGFLQWGVSMSYTSLASRVLAVRSDFQGNVKWSREYSFPVDINYYAPSSFEETGNGYIAALNSVNSDFFLMKTDSLGNVIWSRQYPLGVLVALKTSGSGFYTLSQATSDPILSYIDSSGSIIWTKSYIFSDVCMPVNMEIVGSQMKIFLENHSKSALYLMTTDKLGYQASGTFYSTSMQVSFPYSRIISPASDGFLLSSDARSLFRIDRNDSVIWTKSLDWYLLDQLSSIEEGKSGKTYISGFSIPVGPFGVTGLDRLLVLDSLGNLYPYYNLYLSAYFNDLEEIGNKLYLLGKGQFEDMYDRMTLLDLDAMLNGYCSGPTFWNYSITDNPISFWRSKESVTLDSTLKFATGNVIGTSNTLVVDSQCTYAFPSPVGRIKSHLESSVFPNPFSERVAISVFAGGEAEMQTELSVYDVRGSLVSEKKATINERYDFQIDRTELGAPGIYFYRVKTGRNILHGKLVLE